MGRIRLDGRAHPSYVCVLRQRGDVFLVAGPSDSAAGEERDLGFGLFLRRPDRRWPRRWAGSGRALLWSLCSAPDRLSALSDELLCHVLSFLPSRQAVQTTVLSKNISVRYSDFGGGLGSEFCRLKRLEFQGVSLDACFSERLSSGCPVLEDLVLGYCRNDFTAIQSDTLKSLAILDNELDVFPMFDNLRTFSLNCCFQSERDADKFKALGRFLHKSPNLEKLILKNFWYSEGIVRMWRTVHQPEHKTVKPVIGPIEFPMLENLRTLVLDECDLRDNFRILRHLLWRSPNLEKFTVRHCELPKVSRGQKGNSKLRKTYPLVRNLVRFQCRKLKSTEIIYKKGVKIQELVSFLLDI